MGVLLQGFFFGPGPVSGVPSPLDGDHAVPFWWDHLAAQAHGFRQAGFTAIWIPSPLKGASGGFSSGYDVFDDYDLGAKNQKGTVPTRYGTREGLARCVAVMRANGIDVYVDTVENDRDGDDGHFNFRYVDAFGAPGKGRFAKGPGDFHPHVPEDPGVISDAFQFGRDLAPINGVPHHHCFDGLLDAGDWLVRTLGVQGLRLDNVKGVSTDFLNVFLRHGALVDTFAVAELADGDLGLLQRWAGTMQHRSAVFDFPLHFLLKSMCNDPGSMSMAQLDHAGVAGIDPPGAVTFVENHDTDRGGIGGPVVRNKLLAYAYILTAEGYPCVFYRDYSTDANCFGLKPTLDRLIWIHEHLAVGPTEQRWKDSGVFAFERLGGRHLVVGLNKDDRVPRTITIRTGFPARATLQDFAGHAPHVTTDAHGGVTVTIPRNVDGRGFVCYAPPAPLTPVAITSQPVTQDHEGAADLDIKPARDTERVEVCRVFASPGGPIHATLFFDASHWTAGTSISLELRDPDGIVVAHRTFARTDQGASVTLQVQKSGFHALSVQSAHTPPDHPETTYTLRVSYTAPLTL
jgi:alpha-amylase